MVDLLFKSFFKQKYQNFQLLKYNDFLFFLSYMFVNLIFLCFRLLYRQDITLASGKLRLAFFTFWFFL